MSESESALHSSLNRVAQPPLQPELRMPGLPGLAQTGSASLLATLKKCISFPVVMAVLLAGVALVGGRFRMADPDTWWHVAVGQGILATHHFPTTDTFSFTAQGVHWIAYEWLGEVMMALAARAGGVPGLAVLQMALAVAVAWLLYLYAYVRCGNWKAACAATALFLPIAAPIFSMRPQFFGYVFLLLTLICLERFRQGHSGALWALPPLFLVWVNTHGTFPFGLAAMGLYYVSGLVKFQYGGLTAEAWTKRQRVQLLLAFLGCMLALLVTPYGREIAAYPLQMATMQPLNIANIQEWQPISLSLGIGKYFLALLLALFVAHVFFPVKYRLEELAMLLFGIYAATVHLRFMLIFTILVIPVAAKLISSWIPHYDASKDRYLFNLAIILVLAFSISKLMPSPAEFSELISRDYPVGAISYIQQHPQPQGMFNDYGFGGYLIWQLGSQQKVFIDGRADIYEYAGVFQDYLLISNLDREALPLLDRYDIQSCLIRRTGPLATLLAASPRWHQAYVDDLSVIFVRTPKGVSSGN